MDRRRERGLVIVLLGISLTVLLGIAAFAVDLGYSRQLVRHEQAGTDAGALAGAQELPYGTTADATKAATARSTAASFAVQSLFDGTAPSLPTPTCVGDTCTYLVQNVTLTVTTPYTPPSGVPSGYDAHNFIYVKACQNDISFFRNFLGATSKPMCRDAVARHRFIFESFARGLVSLHPTACTALEFSGSSTTNLQSDGAVVVESNCAPNALDGGGNAWEVQAGLITVVGEAAITPCSIADCLNGTEPVEGAIRQGDPLGGLPTPGVPSAENPVPVSGGVNPISGGPACTVTYLPGRYDPQLSVNNNQVACFAPGVYYLNGGFHSNGNAQLYGENVLFYIADEDLTLNGTGRMVLRPVPVTTTADDPDPLLASMYPWRGITFFQARDNAAEATINGNDASTIGTVYIPGAELNFLGNASELSNPFVTGQVIARTVNISGSGYLTIDAEEMPQGDPPDPDVGLHR